jgi:hypothetical protein
MAPRNSQGFAFCRRATPMPCSITVSASLIVPAPAGQCLALEPIELRSKRRSHHLFRHLQAHGDRRKRRFGFAANCASACNANSIF